MRVLDVRGSAALRMRFSPMGTTGWALNLEVDGQAFVLDGFTIAGLPFESLAYLGVYAATVTQSTNNPPLVRLDVEPGGWVLRPIHDPAAPLFRMRLDILAGDPWSQATLDQSPEIRISIAHDALATSVLECIEAAQKMVVDEGAGHRLWLDFPQRAVRAMKAALELPRAAYPDDSIHELAPKTGAVFVETGEKSQ